MAILTDEEREVDPYNVLGLEAGASENDIRRAYRKKSLKCHPDKNPGEDAAAMFHLISLAQAILLNPDKRKFVDTKLEQSRAAAARRAAMDAKRKVKVEDLLRREEEAKRARQEATEARKAAADEEAVREAGRKLVEEARKKREAAAAAAAAQSKPPLGKTTADAPTAASSSAPPPITPLDLTLSIQLPSSSSLAQPDLESLLTQKYGKLAGVLVAPGKHKDGKKPKGPRAVVEFAPGNWGGCWACMHDLSVGKGVVDGAKAKWATGTEPAWVKWAETLNSKSSSTGTASPAPSAPSFSSTPPSFSSAPDFSGGADPASVHEERRRRRERERAEADALESATLLRMRQKERQRLAEEIRKQEAAEDDEA